MSEMTEILAELNRLRERVAHLETRQEHPGFAASDVARLSQNNTFAGVQTLTNTGLHILDTNATHDLIIAPGSNLTADRTLTLTTGDADRTVTLSGNLTVDGATTITAAAATVLDDATVAAMVDTLGGASSVGTGGLVRATSPIITTDITIPNTGLHLLDTNATHDLIIAPGSNLTADRTLTLTTGDAARTLTLSGNLTVDGATTITTAAATVLDDSTVGAMVDTLGLGTGSSPTFSGLTVTADHVRLPGLIASLVENDNLTSFLGAFNNNALALYADQGGTVTTAVTGGTVITAGATNPYTPNSGTPAYRAFATVTTTNGGTAQWEFTGVSLTIGSHAVYVPFVLARTSTSPISNIQVEYRRSDNVTWDTIFDAAPTWDNMLWIGTLAAYVNYPITGARFTLTYNTVTTTYVAELGIWNKNYIPGATIFGTKNLSNYWSAAQKFALGSASAPGMTFNGDTNTGVWSPGADILAVSTGGTERARIDSSGITLADGHNMVANTTTGSKIGTSTGQKLAFHNSTPVIQRAGAAQAAVATTGATNTTPYGFTTAAQADAIVTLLNEIRAALVEKGLIKGSA